MEVLGLVCGGPWTSSLEGCHPFSAVAGCLDMGFVCPECQRLLPEVTGEVPVSELPSDTGKLREKPLHSTESRPGGFSLQTCFRLGIVFPAAVAGRVVCREKLPSSGRSQQCRERPGRRRNPLHWGL